MSMALCLGYGAVLALMDRCDEKIAELDKTAGWCCTGHQVKSKVLLGELRRHATEHWTVFEAGMLEEAEFEMFLLICIEGLSGLDSGLDEIKTKMGEMSEKPDDVAVIVMH